MRSDTLLVEQLRLAGPVDTLVLGEWRKRPTKTVDYEECHLRMQWSPIFEPRLVWDAGAAGIAALADYHYRIDVFDAGGRLVRSVRRAMDPIRADRDAAIRELGSTPGVRVGDSVCSFDPQELVEARGFYEFIQPIEAIAISPEGRLWVRRTVFGDDTGPIDVFAPDGRYVGTLPDDTPFPLAFLSEDRFVTLETDELDVQFVGVYRIAPR